MLKVLLKPNQVNYNSNNNNNNNNNNMTVCKVLNTAGVTTRAFLFGFSSATALCLQLHNIDFGGELCLFDIVDGSIVNGEFL